MSSETHESRVKHLELIQAVISRQASNAFTVKGWNVLLVSALFALAATKSSWLLALASVLPATFFWALDAYYLCQEKRYRVLYDAVRAHLSEPADFGMTPESKGSAVPTVLRTMFAGPVLMSHLPVLVCAIGYFLFSLCS